MERADQNFGRRRGITFPLLSDHESATIKAYGILNTTVPPTNQTQYGIPFPGTFVVDRQGLVTARFFETAYQERDTVSSVLIRLGKRFDRPEASISAPHLQITTFATDQIVAPGTHFSLIVDVRPENHIHVYAPGVVGYKPVSLNIHPQPGIIVRTAQFPKPSDFVFKPLNEHVKVYQRQFRIIQDVTVDASRDTEAALKEVTELTVDATFEYQACDDRVCFIPQSVPLSWRVRLKALDRERAQRP